MPKDDSLLGRAVNVIITSTGKHYLKCRILSDANKPLNVSSPLPKGQISGLQAAPWVGSGCYSLFFVSAKLCRPISVITEDFDCKSLIIFVYLPGKLLILG